MSVEPIGLISFLVALICLLFGYQSVFIAFTIATVFGAAAAMLIGGANIQPAHFMLGFVLFAVVSRKREMALLLQSVSFGTPGFWFACLTGYGIVSAIFMPILFAETTRIIPLGVSEYADTGGAVPLGRVSSNFTQSVYLIAGLLCFAITYAIGSTWSGFQAVVKAVLLLVFANIIFAVLDVLTYQTGTGWLLEFVRNARYTLHIETEVSGLKRIVGSFPEASAFARMTLGTLAFSAVLAICGWLPAITVTLAIISLVLVIMSTSSTGLVGAPPLMAILYAFAVFRRGFRTNQPVMSSLLLCLPLLAIAAALAIYLNERAFSAVSQYFDILVFSKANSSSAIERGMWNSSGLQNFYDSYGLGVGLGSARTSSYPIAILSNVGIPGLIFYLLFMSMMLGAKRGSQYSFASDVRLAARMGCIALTIGDLVASPVVEQGLFFYILAGLACAMPESQDAALRAPPQASSLRPSTERATSHG